MCIAQMHALHMIKEWKYVVLCNTFQKSGWHPKMNSISDYYSPPPLKCRAPGAVIR